MKFKVIQLPILLLWAIKNHFGLKYISGKDFTASEAIFEESNQQAEKLTNFIHSVVGRASPLWIMLPKLGISFYTYFKIGNDALKLPFAMWSDEI